MRWKDCLESIPLGMLEKGLRIEKTIKNSSEKWRRFEFRKGERVLNASWPWFSMMEERRSQRDHVGEGSDSGKWGRRGLDMILFFFFLNMGRRWLNLPSKKKIELAIEEKP